MKKSLIVLAALCGMAGLAQAAEPQPTGGSFTPPPPDRKPVCTRTTLQAAVDSYVEAQRAGNPRKMAFSGNARFLQDMAPVEPGAGPVEQGAEHLVHQQRAGHHALQDLHRDRGHAGHALRDRHAPVRG